MAETGYFRGAGGVVWELDLPLGENYQRQVDRHELVRVNADGSPYEPEGAIDLTSGEIRRPAASATKNAWVGYAVSQGMSVDEADGMTKADLVDKFGQK